MKINGYIDLQVNGYMGVDFSSPELTGESCAQACREILAIEQIGGFLPTIITSPPHIYERNLAIIAEIIATPEFKGRVLGIHAEGPFISAEEGAVGAHDRNQTQTPDISFLDKMQTWAAGNIKILTIAAEIPQADTLCKYAASNSIAVSLGHQQAGIDELKKLAQAGATLLTHVGNGMPNMVHRHNNSLIAALACSELTAMIVTDGHHLPPQAIEAIINAKGADKVIITSDASPISGMPAGQYSVLGNSVVLEENGLLHNPKKKCLVGSSATIDRCASHLKSLKLLSPEQIDKVSRVNPLNAIRLNS